MATSNGKSRGRSRPSGAGAASGSRASTSPERWSQRVTQTSNALDLEKDVFKQRSPRRIALSLKRSAEESTRRKAEPFRSAMSMLNFYINRAGKNLGAEQKEILTQAKDELRRVFHQAKQEPRP